MKLSVIDPPGVCIENKCTLDFNESFRLAVDIERPPIEGFILAQSRVDFGPHPTYKPAPNPVEEVVLEPCALPVVLDSTETRISHGCIVAIPISIKIDEAARLAEFELTCSQGTTSTLIELVLNTSNGTLVATHALQIEPDLTHVTVNCVQPGEGTPTPTPTHTDTPMPGGPDTPEPTPTDTPEPSPGSPDTPTPTPSDTPTGTPTAATATPATPASTSTSTPVPANTPTQRPSLLGDVNCDGSVNPTDAALLLQLAAALIDELPCPDAGDADGDGETTVIDATVILQFSAGLISSLPP